MPSSIERGAAACPTAEAALLEKIEELSFLRALNDRLARVPDFASACRALVDLVWEDGRADAVAYVSVDPQRRLCRLEAIAPTSTAEEVVAEFGLQTQPFPALLDQREPVLMLDEAPPAWLTANRERGGSHGEPALAPGGVLMAAVMRVRDAPTGVLLMYTRGNAERLEEDRRLLAITATSAALALDAARNEAREEFLAMLRHDINNPITAALGSAELIAEMLQGSGNEPLIGFARSMMDSLEAVADLVSNYLHMAAIDRGVPWLHLEKLDLGELVASIVDRHSSSAAEKRLAVTCHGACRSARADRRQVARVINNLVSNAIKYTPPSGRVDVTVASDDAGATFAVADTGYGLSADDLPRLFTKYARFHQDKGIPGTGLGLYISKAIVEAHGGTVEVSSEPGRGTTFTVRLPHDTA
jgi:signal transduction histidine kinase